MDLGMTVSQMRNSMSVWELLMWSEFYRRERQEVKKMQDKAKKKR